MNLTSQSAKWLLVGALALTGWFGIGLGAAPKASAATAESMQLISNGKKYMGVSYQYGAPSGVTYAFDCSSFTQYVFGLTGTWLPRTSSAQAYMGEPVSKAYLSVGDLLFFNTSGSGISHVGIYAGNGMMLHASSSKGVTLTNMQTWYWQKAYVAARRVL